MRTIALALALVTVACAAPDPAAPEEAAACVASGPVPDMIVSLWDCMLRQEGLPPDVAQERALDALVVAHCESAWNPAVVAYAGRYRTAPHPVTGRTHTEAGVFLLTREEADRHIEGGYGAVLDAEKNIRAAAEVYLELRSAGEDPFSRWSCARSMLAPGERPSWVETYRPPA